MKVSFLAVAGGVFFFLAEFQLLYYIVRAVRAVRRGGSSIGLASSLVFAPPFLSPSGLQSQRGLDNLFLK